MKVLVTGGTGFVGSHSVKAIVDGGHDVRLLVRSPDRLAAGLEPLGVTGVEHVVGDATDEASVRAAAAGCDAALHAAAVYSYDVRDARRMREANVRATEVVLGGARDAGLAPIVYVSSYVALLPPQGVLTGASPVGRPRGAYAVSKAEAERVARRIQDAGAPIATTYPTMVWGPHDPYGGETATFARSALRGQLPMLPRGELPIVDVRDVASAHLALLEGRGAGGRFLLAGGSATLLELIRVIRRLTGRRLPAAEVPPPLLLGAARAADLAQRVLPVRLPVSFAAPWVASHGGPVDASAAEDELGVQFRPLEESIADTIRWLHASGRISARQAGRLAAEPTVP